jgi:23S rRNA (cytosine1962-C5)-methyltransferase
MFIFKSQKEYALIDAGNGFKLEKYGEYLIARPDPQALWPKVVMGLYAGSFVPSVGSGESLSLKAGSDNLNLWPNIDAVFAKSGNSGGSGRGVDRGQKTSQGQQTSQGQRLRDDSAHSDEEGDTGNWIKTRTIPERWPVKFEMGGDLPALNIYARLTPFKHTGIFPEQFTNWKWSMDLIKESLDESGGRVKKFSKESPPKILNLFGYSGAATIACLLAGAHVTHVDSSKGAITWANENAEIAGVKDAPVRWILEDAVSFIKKEVRRGNKYDGIILDPPAFGRGAKGEVWKIEKDFLPFLELIFELLSDDALFLILNGYAAGYSSIAYAQNLQSLTAVRGGVVEHGELCIEQDLGGFEKLIGDKSSGKMGDGMRDRIAATMPAILLPCGIVARWKCA